MRVAGDPGKIWEFSPKMLTARAAVPEGPEAQVDIFTNMTSAFCVSPLAESSFMVNRVVHRS